ncbi:condensation domain-containing protein, partial [Catenulispora pinisilvae]
MGVEASETVPLLTAQLGVWVGQKLRAESLIFNMSQYIDIDGSVDLGILRAALRRVLAETEALRVRIVETDDGVGQQILGVDDLAWDLTFHDLSAEPDPAAAARAWMRADMAHPFDLAAAPLFTGAVLKLSEGHHYWYQRCHHIALDAYGCWLVVRRAAEIYSALIRGAEIPETTVRPLSRLLEDDAEYRGSQQRERDRAYWIGRFAADTEPLLLTGRSAPPEDFALRETVHLAKETVTAVCIAAGLGKSAWPGAALALTGSYLGRLAGVREVTVALPVTSRVTAVQRHTPGMLANVLPLTIQVRPEAGITDVLTEVSNAVRGLLQHQRYRQEDLHNDLRRERGQRTFGPMVNVMSYDADLDFAGVRGVGYQLTNGPVEDLEITISPTGADSDTLRLDFDVNPALHTREDVAAIASRFLRFAEAVAADPRLPVGMVDLLDRGERHRVLTEWNGTPHQVPDTTLVGLFEEQVRRSPDAVAVLCADERVSYADLNARANRLARLLVARGAGPESLVAVALPRSVDLVVTVLAVLKTGAGYVPVDVEYPAERIEFMLADSAPVCVVTVSVVDIEVSDGIGRLDLDASQTVDRLGALSGENLGPDERSGVLDGSCPAYVIYTSGSTGRPKGVVVEHGSAVDYVLWAVRSYPGLGGR